jgi:hypothetical protein
MIKPTVLAVILAAAGLLAAGCRKSAPAPVQAADGWAVLKDGKLVQWIDDKPGRLSSRALPKPGTPPVTNPFLTATSKDVTAEGPLYDLLQKSTSFSDYVDRLTRAGYEVRPATEEERY